MAQRRVPVNRLEVNTVVKPTASPVETYVRPTQEQAVPSELSQFISAITPAVKAVSDKELEEKLKRERELENFRLRAKYKQAENQITKSYTDMENHYVANQDTWHQLSTKEALDKVDRHGQKIVESLKASGADDTVIQTAMLDYETKKIGFAALFNKGKTEYNTRVENDDFIGTVQAHLSSNNDRSVIEGLIKNEINEHAKSFPLADGKPNYKRFDDVAYKFLVDGSLTDPDNALYDYFANENKLYTSERRADSAKVDNRRNALIASNVDAGLKSSAITQAIDNLMETNDKSNLSNVKYQTGTGTSKTVTAEEMEQALLADPRYQELQPAEKLDFLARINYTPTRMKNSFNTFLGLAKTVVPSEASEADIMELSKGFQAWEAMVNSGMDVSWINESDMYHLKAMQYLVREKSLVGQVDIAQDVSPVEVMQGTAAPYITLSDYANASEQAFALRPNDYKLSDKSIKSLGKKVADTALFSTTHGETFNSSEVLLDATKGAKILFASGNYTEDQAIEMALQIAKDDYQLVETKTGRAYSFKSYNTDVEKTSQVVEYINEANQSLGERLKEDINQRFPQTIEEGFDVAVMPHQTNPQALQVKVFLGEGDQASFLGNFIEMDKQEFLTNPDYLNRLQVNVVEELPTLDTTNDNPELTNAIDNVNFFGGAVGRPYPDRPADRVDVLDIPAVATFTDPLRQSPQEFFTNITEGIQKGLDGLGFTKEVEQNVFKAIADVFRGTGEVARPIERTGEVSQEAKDTLESAFADKGVSAILDLPISKAAASTLKQEEGFEASPYDDMGKDSVGYGFQIESLEPDERAMIADINNVTKKEAEKVLDVKVDKLNNWWSSEIKGFENLPESSQVAAVSMAYQLGRENVKGDWPKFMTALQKAANLDKGSKEQKEALEEARYHMLFNKGKDGSDLATDWAVQTPERAKRMANQMLGE